MCRHHPQLPNQPRARRADIVDDLRRAPEVRASDAEREAVAAALRAHAAAGRLDVAELDERLGAAYGATTRGDLATLLADLPAAPAIAAPRPSRPHGGAHDVRVLLLVGLLLVAIWALTGAGAFWPGWVIGWWGLALLVKRPLRAHGRRHGVGLRAG